MSAIKNLFGKLTSLLPSARVRLTDAFAALTCIVVVGGLLHKRQQYRMASDTRWLAAAIHMVRDRGDMLPSTPSAERMKLIVTWGIEHGYKATVLSHDPNVVERGGMYFIKFEKDWLIND